MAHCIACELHDYIEIACIYGYRVKLLLKNGCIHEGKALDIITTNEKREFLSLDNDDLVELTQLATLSVLTPQARFKHLNFP